jgi:hypothetical protein
MYANILFTIPGLPSLAENCRVIIHYFNSTCCVAWLYNFVSLPKEKYRLKVTS